MPRGHARGARRSSIDGVNPVRYTCQDPVAVAHRFGAGLHPENSLTAISNAWALGVRWFETDARASADGVAVLHHDRTLARLFGRDEAVADLTWDQLRSLRTPAGDRLLRPRDVLEMFPGARFAIDVKDPAVLPALLGDVRRAGAAERVCLAGAPDALLARAAAAEPGLRTALGWRALTALVAAARLAPPARLPTLRARARAVPAVPVLEVPAVTPVPVVHRWAHVPDRLLGAGVLTDAVVRRADQLGVHVMAWTVDQPDRMHHLLDMGVRGIITDRPDLLRDVLRSRGVWDLPEDPGPNDGGGRSTGGPRGSSPRVRVVAT